MTKVKITPFYNPEKTYEDNFHEGPFGIFKDGKIFHDKNDHPSKLFNIPLNLPFGIPAGPLLNRKFVKAALDKGFDIPIYKTVRTCAYPCAPWPNVLSVKISGKLTPQIAKNGLVADHTYDPSDLSITNSFGVPSFSPDFWQNDMKDAVLYAQPGQVVVGSFQGTKSTDGNRKKYIADFVLAAKLVKETKAKILEVNLSCPNEGTSHLLCFDIDTSRDVVNAIKNEIGNTPLIVKISYYEDKDHLKKFVRSVGKIVDAIDAINTIPAKIVDEKNEQALPGEGRLISGVCGTTIKWAGLEIVKELKKLRDELDMSYKILGTGGVTTPDDYQAYKSNGADAVMSATGAMWNPYLAQDIKSNLVSS